MLLPSSAAAQSAGYVYWLGQNSTQVSSPSAACAEFSNSYPGFTFHVTYIDITHGTAGCQADQPYSGVLSGHPVYYGAGASAWCTAGTYTAGGCVPLAQTTAPDDQTSGGGPNNYGSGNGPQNNNPPPPNPGCQTPASSGSGGSQPSAGEPVQLSNGDEIQYVEDFTTLDPHAFKIARRYSFQNEIFANAGVVGGAFGANWHGVMDRTINSSWINFYVYTEDGAHYDFKFQSGVYNAQGTGRQDTLVASGSNLIWTSPEGEQTTFVQNATTGAWYVSQIAKLGGNTLTFNYDPTSGLLSTMVDELGRTATLTWSGGVVTSIALPGGLTLSYTYASVTTPAGVTGSLMQTVSRTVGGTTRTVTYKYEDTNLTTALTGIVDERNVRVVTIGYDDSTSRVTSSQRAGGADLTSIAYDDSAVTRTVTNPLGKQAVYQFSAVNSGVSMTSVSGLASTHCAATATAMAYSSAGFVQSYTDENGNETTYVRDGMGKETSRTEAYGTSAARTITTSWGASFPLPTTVAEPTRQTDFTYDTNGNVLTKTITDLTSFTSPYATNGRTRTWTYTYTTQGLLQTVTGPISGSTTTYAYNSSGFLSSVTDALGHVTQITAVNGRGQPTTVVDSNGVTSNLGYDIDGNLTGATINPGTSQSVYAFAYDAAGDLTQITQPMGGTLQYTYDNARRVTQVTNGRSETINYTLDAAGDRTGVVIKNASAADTLQHSNTFDELTRLLISIGANSETTTFGYDLVGNPTQVTDGRSNLFQTAFDPLNRALSQTDPENHTVTLSRDAADNITSVTDGNGLQTTREIDGFGEVIQEVSPDRGTRNYWYDAAGNLTKWVDGDGEETDIAYDLNNRRTSMSHPAASAETVTYSYDSTSGGNYGVDRLTSVSDASGSNAFTYDAQGRLTQNVQTIQTQSYTVAYAYDANSKVTKITLPSGRIINVTRTTDGLVTGVTTQASSGATAQTMASSVAYSPFGPLTSLTYGNGLSLARDYGQNYWLLGVQVTGGASTALDLTINRDGAGSISSIVDNASTGRDATYGYTTSGRLQSAVGPWNEFDYAYDGAGNMIERDTVVSGTKTYSFNWTDGVSNHLTSTTDANSNVLRSLTYRTGGELYQDVRGTQTYEYDYNARKRPVQVKLGGTAVGNYGYNAFDWRVWRETYSPATTTTHYVFDPQGRLLAEHNGSTGAVIKEYVWIEDLPVAVIDYSSGTATTYFIHTGPVNEPLAMTDASQNTVWSAYVEPFGVATVFGTASTSTDLRLPGQWIEAETGNLNQNWYREYDPSLGRYVEADPLGLAAGQNVYAYVDGDPLNNSDPLGLAGGFSPIPPNFSPIPIFSPIPSPSPPGAGKSCNCHTVRMLVTSYNDHGPGSDWAYYKNHPGGVGPGTVAVANTNPPPYSYGTTFNVLNSNGTSAYHGTAYDTGAGWDAAHHNVDPSQWIDIWLPGNQANKWGLQWRTVTICNGR